MQNIDDYYQSIKQVYDEILASIHSPKPIRARISDVLAGIAILIFIGSLIPIIPSVLVFAGSQYGWVIDSFSLTQATVGTYGIAWLLAVIITSILLAIAIRIDNRVSDSVARESRPRQTLSPEQLTFIAIYEAYKELKFYFVSHIDQHVEKSISSLRRISTTTRDVVFVEQRFGRVLEPTEIEIMHLADPAISKAVLAGLQSTFPRQVRVAREFLFTFEKYPWFQLDETISLRLHALISFRSKVVSRLRKREDLPTILTILENMSKFSYAFLPEHKANLPRENLVKLHSEGIRCFDQFAEEIAKLIDYTSEEVRVSKPGIDKVSRKKKMQLLYLNSIFFRFTLWFIILLALTSGLVYFVSLASQDLDINVMLSMIIASSVTGAAALAVFGPKNTMSERTPGSQLTSANSESEDEDNQ